MALTVAQKLETIARYAHVIFCGGTVASTKNGHISKIKMLPVLHLSLPIRTVQITHDKIGENNV